MTGALPPGPVPTAVTAADHVRGVPLAPVTLLEYGDYLCSYCGAAHPVVQELLRRRHGVLRFVYRHFPLTTVHPYAGLAAEVAESAAARDRFWPMHDWLLQHQEQLGLSHLTAGVRQLGLDLDAVAREVTAHTWLDRVRHDVATGLRTGVRGTPAFFVNGARYTRSTSLANLLAAVDRSAGRAR